MGVEEVREEHGNIRIPEMSMITFLMSEDRPFTSEEIAKHFECSISCAKRTVSRARAEGHLIVPTAKGQWYLPSGIRKAAHLVAVTATQAWAIQSSVKAKVLALEQKALIGQMPPKLLT